MRTTTETPGPPLPTCPWTRLRRGTINGENDVDYFKFVLSESTYVVVADHSIDRTASLREQLHDLR